MKSPRNHYKGVVWQRNGFCTEPGFLLRSNLKPGAWVEIQHKASGEYVAYGWPPVTEDGAKITFETKPCYSITTAKKRAEMALVQYDCLIDRNTIGRDVC